MTDREIVLNIPAALAKLARDEFEESRRELARAQSFRRGFFESDQEYRRRTSTEYRDEIRRVKEVAIIEKLKASETAAKLAAVINVHDVLESQNSTLSYYFKILLCTVSGLVVLTMLSVIYQCGVKKAC